MGQVRGYDYLEAPEVEVLWRGQWCFGTLHEWRHQDGSWRGWVRFNVRPGENRVGTFNQDLIRPLIRRAVEPGAAVTPARASSAGTVWVSWSEAAALVGCPASTIEHYVREGHTRRRPRSGVRPTLDRASVETFAEYWRALQADRAERRKNRDQLTASKRLPPDDTGWLHADEVVELSGLGRHRVGQLATLGVLPSQWLGQHLWFREGPVRRWLNARAADAAEWVSWRDAADLIGCPIAAVSNAVERGEIERRAVDRYAPSLRRTSVETFTQEGWPLLVQQQRDRQAAAARRRDELGRRARPPDDEQAWLSRTVTALVLGVSLNTLSRLTTDDKIPHTRVGQRVWYRRDHAEQVAAARALAQDQAARRRERERFRCPVPW